VIYRRRARGAVMNGERSKGDDTKACWQLEETDGKPVTRTEAWVQVLPHVEHFRKVAYANFLATLVSWRNIEAFKCSSRHHELR